MATTRTFELGRRDAFDIFSRLLSVAHQEVFFFESAPEIDATVELSVIGVGPFEVLRLRGGKTEREVNGDTIALDVAFFDQVKLELSSLQRSDGSNQDVGRFAGGGLFGCIGYDSVAELEPKLKHGGYFARQSMSQDCIAELKVAKRLIVFDHPNQKIHIVCATFEASEAEIARGLDELQNCLLPDNRNTDHDFEQSVIRHNAAPIAFDLPLERIESDLGPTEFRHRFDKLQDHISEGDIFQAVLADKFECQTHCKPIEILQELRRLSPAPYSYYFKLDQFVYLGASPETFLHVQNGVARTNPIAGTRPRGQTEADDLKLERQLLRSPKEGAEHLMLVDLARNDLGRVAQPGSVKVTSYRDLKRLSNVMHLVSQVEARLRSDQTALSAFQACFPAGTLSGAPKFRAMQLLSQFEKSPRNFYGGAVVAFDAFGGLDSAIAIRSLEARDRQLTLRAGAGVVADSTAESEYNEILHKTQLIRRAIAAAEARVGR
jgi:anthranilate synthase component 1